MYKVGLTGGIGSGKSTVSDLFKQLAIPIIDADEIARTLVMPGQRALSQINHRFGKSYINTDGTLNRAKLRDIIFSDADKKHKLEAIMHPLIYAEIEHQLSLLTDRYSIIEIPLLIETKMQSLVDHVLVIDCPMEIQINRVKLRDKLKDSQITAMINSQVNRTDRLAHADSIINNTRDITFLSQQVNQLHQQFIKQTK